MAAESGGRLSELIAAAWRAPLARMLLISASLHGALAMILPARPFPPVSQPVALDARLLAGTTGRRDPAPSTSTPRPAAIPPEPVPPVEAAEPAPALRSAESAPAEPSAAAIRPEPGPVLPARPAQEVPGVPIMSDTAWHEARQLDLPPRLVAGGRPDYPPAARRRGIEGSLMLKLHIDEFGAVQELEVVSADPAGVFEESALAAYRQARFQPGRKDGRAVRTLVYVPLRYRLGD